MSQGTYYKLPKLSQDISTKCQILEEDIFKIFRLFVEKNKKRDLKKGFKYFQNKLEEIMLSSIDCTEKHYKLYYDYGGLKDD